MSPDREPPARDARQRARPRGPEGPRRRDSMKRAFIPVASMLAIQVMISLCVLSLSVMMPAVARDLAIDPKLVGVFTAIIYAVAAVVALAAAGPIVRLGAVRVCQAALLMAAIGLALNSLALVAATVVAVRSSALRRADQSRLGPHPAAARAARMVRHGLFAQADRRADRLCPGGVIFPALLELVGWRGASLVAAGAAVLSARGRRAAALEPRRRRGRRQGREQHLALGPLRARAIRSCACSAGRPSSMSSPSTPSPSIS